MPHADSICSCSDDFSTESQKPQNAKKNRKLHKKHDERVAAMLSAGATNETINTALGQLEHGIHDSFLLEQLVLQLLGSAFENL